jgi:hypothetical protein
VLLTGGHCHLYICSNRAAKINVHRCDHKSMCCGPYVPEHVEKVSVRGKGYVERHT